VTAKPRTKKVETDDSPAAMTLRLDADTFMRLSILRAKTRRSAQELMFEALQEYLKRQGA
jgi:predicted transcriptional regulator